MPNKPLPKTIEEFLKEVCIEAQNNKFITPIVFRYSIKFQELFSAQRKEFEESLKRNCICADGYKGRDLIDPKCQVHDLIEQLK